MQTLNQQLLDNVVAIAREAGEHLKRFYARSIAVKIKADDTPVTEADLFISQFLTTRLQQLTPDVPVLSEENCDIAFSERNQWQEYWIIDPLDGTQQFINRTDQFSIVIGLVQQRGKKNQPVLGVIYAPIVDKLYFAMEASGAFLQENGEIRPLVKVEQQTEKPLVIAIGSQIHADKALQAMGDYEVQFLQYGSSSLKAGLVAEGKADCYIRFGDTGEWDTAVAEVLLNEVGGSVFDFNFAPLTYNQRETFINPYFVMVKNSSLNWDKIFLFK
ncbi:3'(2'),5'-bisphosphate nucleotidase CysQ [Mannheimia varigena USDA-ARS-USMARC-1388]|uniref:3'(2'),5'-bisphosphate nucleotidase CysQ n=1 Tax=Mannheimia varigena TaxID=85404 RepID=UPI0003E35BC5|nr:3'(2'),5'-bisphosphate nucleotidase CysQ [Mannheimia varigena]AHG78952.1 3'(2'),5'-bisphosphate nucleotidase CysQ [Mannheimia varigena USDA-ARS-USMARC-1388]